MASITIIGTGNMAKGIGTRALAGDYDLQLLGHEPGEATDLAAELDGNVTTGVAGDAPAGDLVVLALPYDAALEIVRDYGDALAGKVVIDITNPVDMATFDRLVTPAGSSAAEEIEKVAADGVHVVKAFNTTFAGTLVDGRVGNEPLDVLIAGDDADAKQQVSDLAAAGGLRPIDAGPLRRAQQLEALGFLHMALQPEFGGEYRTTVKVLS